MKKIIHILQLKGVGGVQELVLNLAKGLQQNDVESIIFTFKGAEDIYIQIYEKNNIPIYVSPYSVKDVRNIIEILKYIKRNNVNYLHVHNTVPQILCSLILPFINNSIKGIVTEHSQTSKRRKYNLLRFIDELTYHPYHKIVSVSKSVNTTMINWLKHIDKNKFVVIENGIDLSRFADAAALERHILGLSNDDCVIISVGRLNAGKGFRTIIQALEFLPEKYKLVIVGEGEQREELVELSNSMGFINRTIFTGNKRNVESYLKMSDIYVSASQSEGFGLTIIEALAAGLSVIGTDIPAFRDLLPQNQLFPIGDSKRLSELILKGEYSYNKEMLKYYSLDAMIQHYLLLYN